jgi:hypothetical protein
LVRKVQWDPKASPELKARVDQGARRAKSARRDLWAPREKRAKLVRKARQARRAPPGLKGRKGIPECKAWPAQGVRKVRPGLRGQRGPRVTRVILAHKGLRDPQPLLDETNAAGASKAPAALFSLGGARGLDNAVGPFPRIRVKR